MIPQSLLKLEKHNVIVEMLPSDAIESLKSTGRFQHLSKTIEGEGVK